MEGKGFSGTLCISATARVSQCYENTGDLGHPNARKRLFWDTVQLSVSGSVPMLRKYRGFGTPKWKEKAFLGHCASQRQRECPNVAKIRGIWDTQMKGKGFFGTLRFSATA